MEAKSAVFWFLAGAAVWHSLTHVFYLVVGALPLDFKLFAVTPFLNQIEIWGSLILAVLFIYSARR